MSATPSDLRRSPLARLASMEAGSPASGAGGLGRLAIADLSMLPRLGFKGRGTIEAMKKRSIVVESTPNRGFRQADGGLCLVLAPGEVILLSPLAGDDGRLAGLHDAWRIEDEERSYPLLRGDSHAWLAVAGPDAPQMFSKLCAIDLRPDRFDDLSIAQTSLAKMSAIIARADIAGHLVYHILADSAAALYLCNCLLDAAHEFQGRLVEREAVGSLETDGQATPKGPA